MLQRLSLIQTRKSVNNCSSLIIDARVILGHMSLVRQQRVSRLVSLVHYTCSRPLSRITTLGGELGRVGIGSCLVASIRFYSLV